MDSTRAKAFGVIDKVSSIVYVSVNSLICVTLFGSTELKPYDWVQILWRGQEKIMADVAPPEDWDKGAGIKVVDGL